MHRHNAAFVKKLARRVFADRTKAQEWLTHPSMQLGGRSPMETIGSEDGVRRVEELLTQIDDDNQRLRTD